MKKFAWILVACLVASGAVAQWGPPVSEIGWPSIEWLWPSGKPVRAIVVRESSQQSKLTTEQIAWTSDPKFRADAKATGITFQVVDPNDTDRDGKTPSGLIPVIQRATEKGLPRLILVGPKGNLTDFVLPADDAAARKRVGVKP